AEIIDRTGNSEPATAPPRRRAHRWVALSPVVFLFLLGTLWATAALYFDVRVSWLRAPLAAAYPLAVLMVWVFVKRRWIAAGMTAGGFALVLAWWLMLQPSNGRDWQPDVAVLAHADIEGSK